MGGPREEVQGTRVRGGRDETGYGKRFPEEQEMAALVNRFKDGINQDRSGRAFRNHIIHQEAIGLVGCAKGTQVYVTIGAANHFELIKLD